MSRDEVLFLVALLLAFVAGMWTIAARIDRTQECRAACEAVGMAAVEPKHAPCRCACFTEVKP